MTEFEVIAVEDRRPTTMQQTDRLRAVIAIQHELVAAGLDPDAVARLLAERARTLVGGTGATVEVPGDGAAATVILEGHVRVPLVHRGRVFGVLDVEGAEVAKDDVELLEAVGGIAAAQLSHGLDYAQLWRDGREDPLTGLLNRRAYEETLARETARARRHGRELALCLFDLDDFKSVNDAGGHLAGDEVLREFAAVLRGLRGEDHAFRVGGDEFALVLPETDRDGAATVTNRMLERSGIPASVGTATLSEAGEPSELHAAADADLYLVKRRRV